MGFELISFAGGGMSNGGICIQIKTALEMKPAPDLILVNNTYPTRLEWPYNETRRTGAEVSVKDMLYAQPESLAKSYSWINTNPKIISYAFDQILINDDRNRLTDCIRYDIYREERIDALKKYFLYLHHPDVKNLMDQTMMVGMMYQLHESGIPYILLKDAMPIVAERCKFLGPYNYASPDTSLIYTGLASDPGYKDPGYHTNLQHQIDVAEILLNKYIPNLLKDI